MVYGDPDYNVGINYAGKNYTTKWNDYIDWYKVFAAETEKKLAGRLNIIHLQSIICQNEKDEETAEFLSIMRRIIIEARLYKWDNNIADELGEIKLSVATTELLHEKHEHRKKVLEKLSKPIVSYEPQETKPEPQTDNSVQLGLF
jgi:hypothetical protein